MIYCNKGFKTLLGENFGKYEYGNLILNKKSAISFYTQDKLTGKVECVNEVDNKWGYTERYISSRSMVDGNENTVYDFLGGHKNKVSYNFLIDFCGSEVVDKIRFASAKNNNYFPNKLNIYIGNSREEVFAPDAVPVKSFEGKTEDGVYSAEFSPTRISYGRIEVLDSGNDYYGDMIIVIVRDISAYGAIGAPAETYGKEMVKRLKRAVTEPVTLMQPFLYNGDDGWVNTECKKTAQFDFDDISAKELGEGFSCVNVKKGRLINIGSTNDVALISKQQNLPEFSGFKDLYFYVKLKSNGECGDGKFLMQIVAGCHTWTNFAVNLIPDVWQKISIRDYVNSALYNGYCGNVEAYKLRRIAINPIDGKMDTELCVGSVMGVKSLDLSALGVDLEAAEDWSKEKWEEMLKGGILEKYLF